MNTKFFFKRIESICGCSNVCMDDIMWLSVFRDEMLRLNWDSLWERENKRKDDRTWIDGDRPWCDKELLLMRETDNEEWLEVRCFPVLESDALRRRLVLSFCTRIVEFISCNLQCECFFILSFKQVCAYVSNTVWTWLRYWIFYVIICYWSVRLAIYFLLFDYRKLYYYPRFRSDAQSLLVSKKIVDANKKFNMMRCE